MIRSKGPADADHATAITEGKTTDRMEHELNIRVGEDVGFRVAPHLKIFRQSSEQTLRRLWTSRV